MHGLIVIMLIIKPYRKSQNTDRTAWAQIYPLKGLPKDEWRYFDASNTELAPAVDILNFPRVPLLNDVLTIYEKPKDSTFSDPLKDP